MKKISKLNRSLVSFPFLILIVLLVLAGSYFFFKPPAAEREKYNKELGAIELKLNIHKETIKTSAATKKFDKPILLYLIHKKDKVWKLFYTFAIADFKKGEITYLTTYLPENLRKFENHPLSRQINFCRVCQPHSQIFIHPEEDFYAFMYDNCNFFYYVNMKDKIAKIITKQALAMEDSENIVSFGNTFFKAYNDSNAFYMATRLKAGEGCKAGFYKLDLDLTNIDKIFETQKKDYCEDPHSVRNYKNYLLIAMFMNEVKVKLVNEDLSFETLDKFYDFVIKDSYKNLSLSSKFYAHILNAYYYLMNLKDKTMAYFLWQADEIKNNGHLLTESKSKVFHLENPLNKHTPAESYFRKKHGTSYREFSKYCSANEKYNFRTLPGRIKLFDLETKREEDYPTTFPSPAHFQIDEAENTVYASNHNLEVFNGKLVFLGNAGINKFKISAGKLIHIATFTDPKCYRMSTFRLFKFEGKPYLVTFGEPNRLFLIDAESMELIHFEDIGRDFLSNETNPQNLKRSKAQELRISSMEVSDDGSTIFFMSQEFFYFYSFPERKIIEKIKVKKTAELSDGINLKDFNFSLGHTQFVEWDDR